MRETKRSMVWACATAVACAMTGAALAEPVGQFTDHKDLGNPPTDPQPGAASFDGTTYTVTGGGNDWWDGGEFGHIVYKPIAGDFRLEANVKVNGDPVDNWFKAGLFVRNTVDTGGAALKDVNAIAAVTDPFRADNTRQALQYRPTATANMTNVDVQQAQPNDGTGRLALQRRTFNGTAFVEAFYDRGTGTFAKLGGVSLPNLANNAFAGLFVTSHQAPTTETAQFTNVQFVAPVDTFALSNLTAARTVTASPGSGAAGKWSVTEVTNNGDLGNLTATVNSINNGAGTRQNYEAAVINILDSDTGDHFGSNSLFKSDPDQAGQTTDTVNNIAIVARTGLVIPTAGMYTLGVNSDDGFELSVDGKIVAQFDAGRGAGDTLGTVTLDAGVHDLRLLYWEGTGGGSVEVFGAAGFFGAFDPSMRLIGDTANGGLAITAVPEPTSIGFLALGGAALLGRRNRKRA
jgi:hypothetical protein